MSADVIPIDCEIVTTLEAMLSAARKGELHSIAIAWALPGGGTHHRCVHLSGSRPMQLLGEISVMAATLVERFR